jgi:nucleoid-associated protein YgaU
VERPRLRALPPPTPARAPVARPAQAPAPRPAQATALRPAQAPVLPAVREERRAAGTGPRSRPRPASAPARPAHIRCGGNARPASPDPLRLTARGRLLVTVFTLTLGVVLAAVVGAVVGGAGRLRLAGGSSVVVRPGDTVWEIAASISGEEDVRAVIDEIERLNGLDRDRLTPGQVLRLP